MRELEAVDDNRFSLGRLALAAGSTEKFRARYGFILSEGVVLSGATATISSPTSTLIAPALSDDRRSLVFGVVSTLTYETFTVAIQVTTSDGQTLNYTVVFDVQAPFMGSSVPNPLPLLIGPTGATGPKGATGSGGSSGLYSALLAGGT